LTTIDRRIIEFVTRRTSPASATDLVAFATLYDSRLTLKRELTIWLTAKSVANLAFLVPPPWGYPLAIVAALTHVAATSQIALIGKEWLLLDVLQSYGKLASPLQERIFAAQLIPTLVSFAAEAAGLDPGQPDQPAEGGLAVDRIADTVTTLSEQHRVTAELVPDPQDRRLPVQFEPKPNGQGRSSPWPSGWGTDQPIQLPTASGELDDMQQSVDQELQKITRGLDRRERLADELEETMAAIDARIDGGELSNDVRAAYQEERAEVENTLAEIRQEIESLQRSKEQITQQQAVIDPLRQAAQLGESQNLSLRHIPQQMDPDQERLTQWVRATAPYLDALRAPLLGLMESQLPKSRAAEHFQKWTNRYALIRAWKLRSAMRLEKTATASARWSNQGEPLAMVVLEGAFDQQQPVKGNEAWTRSDASGRSDAEQRFTLLTMAHRDYQSLFATGVYPTAQQNGVAMVSQSILYNANPQRRDGSADSQASIGWDTLNWDTNGDDAGQQVPEWGRQAAVQSTRWPWELFDGLDQAPRVKLNWQAKLVPVTQERLKLAAEAMESAFNEAATFAERHADLISH